MKQYSGFTVHIHPNINGLEIIVRDIVKRERNITLSLVPIIDGVEYEPETVNYRYDFFLGDILYLFEIIKAQAERKHQLNETISLTELFKKIVF